VDGRAAGTSRWVEVPPERFPAWLAGFAGHHGAIIAEPDADGETVTFAAADGARAESHPPFPPFRAGADDAVGLAERIAAHAVADRTVGVLLVRLGGYAAGVFTGGEQARLVASKAGARLVHGRSAAGGTSQQRFARRRENQARDALNAAAQAAAAVFAPFSGKLDAVVLGGDRQAIGRLREDARLRPYLKLAVCRFLTVPDPRLAVLRATPRQFRAIRIRLTDPAGQPVRDVTHAASSAAVR
jgi:hypothetical protein